ncbi:MAG: hypothetical protein J6Y00_02670 [Paludibacteraceae bacterium]|nr:hypothetical protein [Paludibacteraceae bacterium]
MAKNVYSHTIDLKKLNIRNAPREEFAEKVIAIEYRGYEVEQCDDGRKIVITKPGGKSVYGRPKKEDILVFIFDPCENFLWQISHQQILDDVTAKCEENPAEGKKLIALLEKTLKGEEPNDFIADIHALSFQTGENPEELIKAYKWIWGQEDVNYPNGEGRFLSWGAYEKLLKNL